MKKLLNFKLGILSQAMISNRSGVLGLIGILLFFGGIVAIFTWWLGAAITTLYCFGPAGLSIGMALWNGVLYTVSALLGGILSVFAGVAFMVVSCE